MGRKFDLGTIVRVQNDGGVPVIIFDRWTARGVANPTLAANGVPIHVHSDAPYENLNNRITYRIPVAQGAGFTKLAIKPWSRFHAAFLTAGYRVRGGRGVFFGRPGPGLSDFGALAGVPGVGRRRRNPLRTRAGVSLARCRLVRRRSRSGRSRCRRRTSATGHRRVSAPRTGRSVRW